MVKRCLILGSANCLRDDIEAALAIGEFDGVVAAKQAGLEWRGRLDAWVTLHPDRAEKMIAERSSLQLPPADAVYGHKTKVLYPGVTHQMDYLLPGQRRSGSSGLFAVKVALSLGFDRLVLCGIPLQRDQGRIDGKKVWTGSTIFMSGWLEAKPHIMGKVKSMSGWTAIQLGKPTASWLNT